MQSIPLAGITMPYRFNIYDEAVMYSSTLGLFALKKL